MELNEYTNKQLLEEIKHRELKVEYSHNDNDDIIITICGVQFHYLSPFANEKNFYHLLSKTENNSHQEEQ